MPDSIGPRTYLVGKILHAMITVAPTAESEALATTAVRLADLTLNAMGWSDGNPHSNDAHDMLSADELGQCPNCVNPPHAGACKRKL